MERCTWILIVFLIVLFILAELLTYVFYHYVLCDWWHKVVIIPVIQHDNKGFSSNELSLLKSLAEGGCGLSKAQAEEQGSIIVVTPEFLSFPPAGSIKNQQKQTKPTKGKHDDGSLKVTHIQEFLDYYLNPSDFVSEDPAATQNTPSTGAGLAGATAT